VRTVLATFPRLHADPFVTSRYQGHVGAYLVIGGVDDTGAHLFTVHAHGSTDKLPYVTMGSGSMAAMAVFESGYKEDLTVCPRWHTLRGPSG
jgi:20S proteasome alpha/beta subunit